ncbi:hypothetical protein CAOG_08823 [Capsaspora owczarzaki ATCC 30864]|uniref:Trafficking protein particle complex subunit 10 n=1 Tax=Capsaspora owczarzaki (strain ATCC 30864) TaxID=595528 RepID=A0A0D2WS05_CAPO3|nr:hypothetical protein CAOG_08823 [Capsaspora owczarzaki ATCC 30864]KJE94103.1 hypothetical protein CAOG_008823 [Capsaspora owczarzaki ATCC 30864]|eukprot:XP_011270463.1 hypothetical protein CAOG_08823 [Capsaspora owczarzaki ATCC 30864]
MPRPVVTYLDDAGLWPVLSRGFSSRLPLTNLTWQSGTSRRHRIAELDIQLQPFSSTASSAGKTADRMGALAADPASPFLHLFIVNCEDTDQYKAKVKQTIADWLESFKGSYKQEWLIIYATMPTSATATKPKLQLSKLQLRNVYDRIKSDFDEKNNRCIQFRGTEGEAKLAESWDELFGKVQNCLMKAFDRRVVNLEDNLRKALATRHMPGWNYCAFFIMKESLAFVFDTMTLAEEALFQYLELDVLFAESVALERSRNNGTISWMEHFGGDQPNDDSASIFDPYRKPYRDLIQQNAVTMFDFRVYLFAKIASFLRRLERSLEVTRRAYGFITELAYTMSLHSHLSSAWISSWVFSSCLETLSSESTMDSFVDQQNVAVIRADLCAYAREQLDQLGVRCGLLPCRRPFAQHAAVEELLHPQTPPMFVMKSSQSATFTPSATKTPPRRRSSSSGAAYIAAIAPQEGPSGAAIKPSASASDVHTSRDAPSSDSAPPTAPTTATATTTVVPLDSATNTNQSDRTTPAELMKHITSPKLRMALDSPDAFDALYAQLCELAMDECVRSMRSRQILPIKHMLAELMFHRGHYEHAEQLFGSMCDFYLHEGWPILDFDVRRKFSVCQKLLGHFEAYSRSCMLLSSTIAPLPFADRLYYFRELMGAAHPDNSGTQSIRCSFNQLIAVQTGRLWHASAFDEWIGSQTVKRTTLAHTSVRRSSVANQIDVTPTDEGAATASTLLVEKAVSLLGARPYAEAFRATASSAGYQFDDVSLDDGSFAASFSLTTLAAASSASSAAAAVTAATASSTATSFSTTTTTTTTTTPFAASTLPELNKLQFSRSLKPSAAPLRAPTSLEVAAWDHQVRFQASMQNAEVVPTSGVHWTSELPATAWPYPPGHLHGRLLSVVGQAVVVPLTITSHFPEALPCQALRVFLTSVETEVKVTEAPAVPTNAGFGAPGQGEISDSSSFASASMQRSASGSNLTGVVVGSTSASTNSSAATPSSGPNSSRFSSPALSASPSTLSKLMKRAPPAPSPAAPSAPSSSGSSGSGASTTPHAYAAPASAAAPASNGTNQLAVGASTSSLSGLMSAATGFFGRSSPGLSTSTTTAAASTSAAVPKDPVVVTAATPPPLIPVSPPSSAGATSAEQQAAAGNDKAQMLDVASPLNNRSRSSSISEGSAAAAAAARSRASSGIIGDTTLDRRSPAFSQAGIDAAEFAQIIAAGPNGGPAPVSSTLLPIPQQQRTVTTQFYSVQLEVGDFILQPGENTVALRGIMPIAGLFRFGAVQLVSDNLTLTSDELWSLPTSVAVHVEPLKPALGIALVPPVLGFYCALQEQELQVEVASHSDGINGGRLEIDFASSMVQLQAASVRLRHRLSVTPSTPEADQALLPFVPDTIGFDGRCVPLLPLEEHTSLRMHLPVMCSRRGVPSAEMVTVKAEYMNANGIPCSTCVELPAVTGDPFDAQFVIETFSQRACVQVRLKSHCAVPVKLLSIQLTTSRPGAVLVSGNAALVNQTLAPGSEVSLAWVVTLPADGVADSKTDFELAVSFGLDEAVLAPFQLTAMDVVPTVDKPWTFRTTHQLESWMPPFTVDMAPSTTPLERSNSALLPGHRRSRTVEHSTLVLGEATSFEMRIRRVAQNTLPAAPSSIYYTLQVRSDMWMVAGRDRGVLKFDTSNEEEAVVQFSLIPMMSGDLLLPNVELSSSSTREALSHRSLYRSRQLAVR